MYSLYRAWLSLGPCPVPALPPPAPAQSPPDVTLQVGPAMTQFSAHRAVLSTHSGFFKAALLNHTDRSPIAVPNVNVDEFSSLLTFMYTGYLDLNLTNIYNILLATHILHMPRALEICRSFLLQSQPSPLEPRPSIIKPIPSRKTVPTTPQICAPTLSQLHKSESTPFKSVKASTSKCEEPQTQPAKPEKSRTKKKGADNDKVIVDIACCDGPVRFHRVVNKNYGHQTPQPDARYEVQEVNRNAALNKAMTENIREQLGDENQANGTDLFTCLYCNHTFKSQYCYQKHARRHLNPVSLDAKTSTAPKESKREVKLLDMNVQYYPCKTCGSKFPSYYFVHKHRKLCHADEMADNDNKNNEMLPENDDNSSGSAIDVEAINADA